MVVALKSRIVKWTSRKTNPQDGHIEKKYTSSDQAELGMDMRVVIRYRVSAAESYNSPPRQNPILAR